MIFTDGQQLVAITLQALHSFAKKVGFNLKDYSQGPDYPHYKITTKPQLELCLGFSAIKVDTKAIKVLTQNFEKEYKPTPAVQEQINNLYVLGAKTI